jgi:Pectate lyase superfamily protein
MSILVKVGGSDISTSVDAGSLTYTRRHSARGTASFTAHFTEWHDWIGAAVEIWVDGVCDWGGKIANVRWSPLIGGGRPDVAVSVDCVSREAILDSCIVEKESYWTDATAGSVVADILTKYLAADNILAGTISTGASVPRYMIDHQTATAVLDDLAARSGFSWEITPTRYLNFRDPSLVMASFAISDAYPHAVSLSAESSDLDYANQIYRRIADSAVPVTREALSGATGIWTLTQTVWTVDSVWVNGYLESVGVSDGVTNSPPGCTFYYIPATRSFWHDGGAPVTGVVVNYRVFGAGVVVAENAAEIAARAAIEQTSGQHGRVVEGSDINIVAAQQACNADLTASSVLPVAIRVRTMDCKPIPGTVVNIVQTTPAINGNYIIQDVTATVGGSDAGGDYFVYDYTASDVMRLKGWQDWARSISSGSVNQTLGPRSSWVSSLGGSGAPDALLVTSFGAKGDGTTDDTEAIRATYSALPPRGGVIGFPPGQYKVTSTIYFDVSGKPVMLTGAPGNASEILFTGTWACFDFNYGNDHRQGHGVRDLTFTGPGVSTGTCGVYFGGGQGAEGFLMDAVKVQNFQVGLEMGSETWIASFRDCMFRNNGTNVVLPTGLTNAGENIQFIHCTFCDAPAPHTDSVWVKGGGQEVVFTDCSFDHAQLRIGSPGSGGGFAAQVTVKGCHFENPNYGYSLVNYDYITVDYNNGNYLRLTDSYFLNDRPTGGPSRFCYFGGGVVHMSGIGMYTPGGSPLANFAVLANNVNVVLIGFNDLSANITSGLYGGSTTGFMLSLPGASTGRNSGYNNIIGAEDLVGGAKFQVKDGNIKAENGQLVSTIPAGTPPLVVNSNTKVVNLSVAADLCITNDGSNVQLKLDAMANVVAGTGITVSHPPGSITISTVQDISTVANPTFATVTCTWNVIASNGARIGRTTSDGIGTCQVGGIVSVTANSASTAVIAYLGQYGGTRGILRLGDGSTDSIILDSSPGAGGFLVNAKGNIRAEGGQLVSTIATGTAPLAVNSTTKVVNLSVAADLCITSDGSNVQAKLDALGTNGVNSIYAGTGVSVSANTGSVTVSIGQDVSTGASPTLANVTATSGAKIGRTTSDGMGTCQVAGSITVTPSSASTSIIAFLGNLSGHGYLNINDGGNVGISFEAKTAGGFPQSSVAFSGTHYGTNETLANVIASPSTRRFRAGILCED